MNLKKLIAGATAVLACMTLPQIVHSQTWLPYNYWTFDQSNALKDDMNRSDLNAVYYQSPYSISNASSGSVGKSLSLNSQSKILVASSPLPADSGFTIEMLFKPGANMNQTVQLFSRRDGSINIRFGYPNFRFTTRVSPNSGGNPVSDSWDIMLTGIGRGSFGYYTDGNWHHLVFKYNAKTGVKELWVDGQLPAGFTKTVPAGRVPLNSSNPNENICDINSNTSYYKTYGNLDEIAVYTYALHPNMIYKHYQNFTQGQHYNFQHTTVVPPAPAPVTAGIDINEYGPGHPNVNVDAWNQLRTFPTPRYKPGHTLFPNVPVFSPAYLAGYNIGNTSYSTALQRSKDMQREFVTNFNYTLMVTDNTHNSSSFNDTNKFDGAWIKMGNQNPSWKTSANQYWTQINPQVINAKSNDPYANCRCLPSNSYLRNSSGQFLDRAGNVITTTLRTLSPETPIDSIKTDGKTAKFYLQELFQNMTRPLDALFENAEMVPWWSSNGLAKDPVVNAAKNSSGLDWSTYIGKRMFRISQAYVNEFRTLPQLSNTRFSYYQIMGNPAYNWKYSETRTLNSTVNGQVYPSGDIYPSSPGNWRFWSGAWKGWQFVVDARYHELQHGDKLFSPVVSPGWNRDETVTMRPGQWLGFLKAVAMTGVENFQTGYFVTTTPFQLPENYVWQMVYPSYVQALSSRYEDLLRNGSLMNGDVPNDIINNPGQPGYSFYAGDIRKLVVARKHNTLGKYAITGTVQNNSNMQGNSELETEASINLDGQNLKFMIRRQGSVYIYDKSAAGGPVFYQLDGWHEYKHPYYWSKSFDIEGELYDNTNSNLEVKTRVPAGTQTGDYRNFTSSVSFKTSTAAEYNFQPRGTSPATHYVWVRARSKAGVAGSFSVSLDNGPAKTINCVQDTAWLWYRMDAANNTPISYSNLSLQNHKLTITSSNGNVEIDKITITPVSGNYYTTGVAPACGQTSSNAVITPNGSTTFCQGGSVILSANTGTSYLWSNGSTSKNITVTTSGTYTVTVYNGGSSAVSAPVSVVVNAKPSATVNQSGPLTLCQGSSVTLTSAATSGTYQWSNGSTSRSITVNSAGSYVVTVTSPDGCSATSSPSNVTVSSGSSTTATISPAGTVSICGGSSTTLTANSGSSYLWSTGATTRSISVNTPGTYTVTVSGGNGCPGVSAPTVVTAGSLAPFYLTASGPLTFCNGGGVTFTAPAGTGYTYMWFKNSKVIPGATSQTYRATSAGLYKVRIQQGGCTQYGPSYTVTVPCREGEELTTTGFDATVFPNPAVDHTTIAVTFEKETTATIQLYDAQARLVEVIEPSKPFSEGLTEISYSTANLNKGIYFIRIETPEGHKMVRFACL